MTLGIFSDQIAKKVKVKRPLMMTLNLYLQDACTLNGFATDEATFIKPSLRFQYLKKA